MTASLNRELLPMTPRPAHTLLPTRHQVRVGQPFKRQTTSGLHLLPPPLCRSNLSSGPYHLFSFPGDIHTARFRYSKTDGDLKSLLHSATTASRPFISSLSRWLNSGSISTPTKSPGTVPLPCRPICLTRSVVDQAQVGLGTGSIRARATSSVGSRDSAAGWKI